MEGFLAPEIYLRRGLTYTFKVRRCNIINLLLLINFSQIEGGNDPRSAEFYHPFIITDEPVGGYYR